MRINGIDQTVWLQHAWLNWLQSSLLLAFMGGFLALLGWLLFGGSGVLMLLAVGVVGVLFNPVVSPRLMMTLYGASPIPPNHIPQLWALVSLLKQRAGLDAPLTLYYVPSRLLNAFAVGTSRQAAIAVTDGLMRQLDVRQLAGVLAHEISHIRNNDLWVMGLADMFSRATTMLSLLGQVLLILSLPLWLFSIVSINWPALLLLVFAPSVSALAQMALSRNREYNADLNAARLTGDPDGLASALARIERAHGGWVARLMLPGQRLPEPSVLRSHPDTEARIAKLMALKPQLTGAGMLPIDRALDLSAVLDGPVTRPPRRHFSGLWH